MSRFERSWLLFKNCFSIMTRNKRLLVFPVLIFLFTLLIILFFLGSVLLRPTGYAYTSAQHWQAIGHSLFTQTQDAQGHNVKYNPKPVVIVWLLVTYFGAMFSATFFNVAFYHEILAVLKGDTASIARGLKFAGTRWQAVLMWSLFAGLVGLLIRQLEQRLSFMGQIVVSFIGMAWSIASVFVIPSMVQDQQNNNPIRMLKDSANVLRRIWGEALIGYVGISLASGLVLIGSMGLVIAALVGSIKWDNYWLIGIVGGLWLVAMFVLTYLSGVAGQIYKGALYLYATDGVVTEPFSQELLDSAWKFKKN